MENNKDVVVDTTIETESAENTFTQLDVNNIVARNVKEETEKILRGLGVEDFENAKKGLAGYKKYQESQKTELENATTELSVKDKAILTLTEKLQGQELSMSADEILKGFDVDTKHKSTVLKLVDRNDLFEGESLKTDEFKTRIQTTLEKDLSMLLEDGKVTKAGIETKEQKPKVTANKYLEAYKKLKDK